MEIGEFLVTKKIFSPHASKPVEKPGVVISF